MPPKKRHRSFTPAPTNVAPLTFDLHDETFECKPRLQGSVILEFIADSEDSNGTGAGHLLKFFDRALLTDDDRERFDNLVHSDDKIVEIETLAEIIGWLVEEYTARPTRAS